MTDLACTREGCQVGSTGKCLEGFDPLSACPYLPESPTGAGDSTSAEQTAFVSLPTGEALSEIHASEITRAGNSVVVILAGPHESGKTTIITSLFESFLEAPFANYLFAGSRTLAGFERRCFDAREESGRTTAHTVHTPVSETAEFLHLRLRSAGPTVYGARNLLLSDVSGERFRALRDSAEAVRGMRPLGRADHLCLVIDGKKLGDSALRHSARNDARILLRSIVEAGTLANNCRVQIVFSKWDIVLNSPDQASLQEFIKDSRSVLSKMAKQFAGLSFHEVAARPETRPLPFAHGVANLLRTWLEERVVDQRPAMYLSKVGADAREFARFSHTVVATKRLEERFDVRWI